MARGAKSGACPYRTAVELYAHLWTAVKASSRIVSFRRSEPWQPEEPRPSVRPVPGCQTPGPGQSPNKSACVSVISERGRADGLLSQHLCWKVWVRPCLNRIVLA